jgi:hypothetical protein
MVNGKWKMEDGAGSSSGSSSSASSAKEHL